MENLEEMDKFLKKINLPKLNEEEIENFNRPITSTDIETVIKNLPQTKTQDQMASQVNSTKNSGRTSTIVLKLFHIIAAAAAAKSLQLCPTLCNPRDGSPPGSPVPGILQARTLEWVAISFSNA